MHGSIEGGLGKVPETRDVRLAGTGVAREDKERVQKLVMAGLGNCVAHQEASKDQLWSESDTLCTQKQNLPAVRS